MLITPPVVFVVAAMLVLLARPGLRGATWRAARRPVGVAAFTVVFVAALALLAWHGDVVSAFINRVSDAMATDPLLYLVLLAVAAALVWFVVFLASALYLAQRNGLNHDRSLPLMAPLVQVLVIWLYLGLAADVEPNHFTGWRLDVSRYGTPAAVTILAIIEVIQLRRRFAVGFRDPFPRHPAPHSPPWTDREPHG